MKIEFHLEDSDLDIEFTPDFLMPGNYSDTPKVQWNLQYDANKKHLDDVQLEFSSESPIFKSNVSVGNMRL